MRAKAFIWLEYFVVSIFHRYTYVCVRTHKSLYFRIYFNDILWKIASNTLNIFAFILNVFFWSSICLICVHLFVRLFVCSQLVPSTLWEDKIRYMYSLCGWLLVDCFMHSIFACYGVYCCCFFGYFVCIYTNIIDCL